MKGAPWLPWERTEPPVPGREPKGSHRLPGASREGPGLQPQTPPPGQLGVPGLREPPPPRQRVAGLGALRPRGGERPRCLRPRAPPHPAPAPPSARSHPPCRSRGRRRRPWGRGPAAGAVPTQRRCCPAAELRPVPRPVPAREQPRRQPRRRCSVRRRQRPPLRTPSVPPAGCGGRRDGLHQPRLYSGPWAAGRGRECGTRRAASSRRQRGTERKGRRGQGRGGVDPALHTH